MGIYRLGYMGTTYVSNILAVKKVPRVSDNVSIDITLRFNHSTTQTI